MPFESVRSCANCRRRTVVYLERAQLPAADATLDFECRACGHRNSGQSGTQAEVSRVPASSTVGWITAAQRLPQAAAAPAPAAASSAPAAVAEPSLAPAPARVTRFTNKPKKLPG